MKNWYHRLPSRNLGSTWLWGSWPECLLLESLRNQMYKSYCRNKPKRRERREYFYIILSNLCKRKKNKNPSFLLSPPAEKDLMLFNGGGVIRIPGYNMLMCQKKCQNMSWVVITFTRYIHRFIFIDFTRYQEICSLQNMLCRSFPFDLMNNTFPLQRSYSQSRVSHVVFPVSISLYHCQFHRYKCFQFEHFHVYCV